MCALDVPSRRLPAMQGNLVPVTSVPLVFLTDHRPGWGLDTAKGPLTISRTTNITSEPRLPAGDKKIVSLRKRGHDLFRRRVACILHALSRVLGAGALLK